MEDEIAEIANKSFVLYTLTPLLKFHLEPISDRELQLKIHVCTQLKLKDTTRITRTTPGKKNEVYLGDLVDLHIEPLYFDNVASYDSTILPLKITIEIMLYKDNRNVTHTFFMLPSPYIPMYEKKADEKTFYPLILVKATSRIKSALFTWFEKRYFALCTQLYIPPIVMTDMVNIWIESIHNLPDEDAFEEIPDMMTRPPLILEYKTDINDLSDIKVSINQQDAKVICKKIQDRRLFLEAFQDHILKTTSVRLRSFTFHRVSNSLATLRQDGSVKINGHAYKIFAVQLLQSWIHFAAQKVYKR
ncbi:uncharacterized protein BX663DRAFT_513271 [Cokeromyces recurvatus]|uniref:uncharacterized protein n=1 Tax=Cokeromyces recurvatus TaxID=90255 RepID=UPI00221FC745|nr:uncharacterized protein BX663DRAFT_513271 [Cokeromyces recurvatus]KAI7901556.1 hypothetical protein BX663DRAFT_513271 [Cokeromyces recurvatus]